MTKTWTCECGSELWEGGFCSACGRDILRRLTECERERSALQAERDELYARMRRVRDCFP